MTPELQAVLNVALSLAADEVPPFLGQLENIRAVAWSRLTPPAPASQQVRDELLDVDAAAKRLCMSASYLYRHHGKFPFSRRVGRSLRFSAEGINSYIQESEVFTRRRPAGAGPKRVIKRA
jgi:predicted DNA-binding transcriptional regulator AlpA